jgi:hypothetical protein
MALLHLTSQHDGRCLKGLVVTEIYLHPATSSLPGAVPSYRYRDEFEALMSPAVLAACRDLAVRLGGFADFLPPSAAGDGAADQSYGAA